MGIVRAIQVARTPGGSFARLALVWTVLPLLFFSFAQTKLPNYIALLFPALAIVVGMWFAQVSRGADRRPALISAATVPLTVGCIAFAIVMFGRSNQLAISAVGPQLVVLAAGMLVGSLLVVVSLARSPLRAAAPYILALTSLVLVLFHRVRRRAGCRRSQTDRAHGGDHQRPARAGRYRRDPGRLGRKRAGVLYAPRRSEHRSGRRRQFSADGVRCGGRVRRHPANRRRPALEALAQRANRTMTTLDTNGRTVLIRVDGGPAVRPVDPKSRT